jgi:hypothetical protein
VAATADWRVLSWLQPHYHSFLPWAKAVNGQVARSTRCSFARRGIVASSVVFARQTQTCAQHHPHATIQGARRSEPRAPSPCPLPTHVRDESLGIKARHPANARCNACQLGVMRCSYSQSCERNVPSSPLFPIQQCTTLPIRKFSTAPRTAWAVIGCCFAAHALRGTLLLAHN